MFIYLNKKIAIPNQVKLRCAQWNTEHVRAARLRAREGEGERGREGDGERGSLMCRLLAPARAHGHAYRTLAHPLSLASSVLVPRLSCA